MKEQYYIVKQTLPYLDTKINKIYCPTNISHLKKLISFMIGKIEVYLYTEENGERENLTSILGNENFNIYEHKIESLRLVKMLYYNSHFENKYISFYSLSQIKLDLFPNFFMLGYVFRLKSSEMKMSVDGISCNLAEHNKRQKYGNSYEIFIANKYKETGYEVENRGVKESFNDGGLDIIAIKDNNIVLVQCKNWTMSNSYKINQKDIRAFVGDCFLYLKDIDLEQKKVSYHFIVSHNNILTESAEIFLKQNTFIKFKCVAFENEN